MLSDGMPGAESMLINKNLTSGRLRKFSLITNLTTLKVLLACSAKAEVTCGSTKKARLKELKAQERALARQTALQVRTAAQHHQPLDHVLLCTCCLYPTKVLCKISAGQADGNCRFTLPPRHYVHVCCESIFIMSGCIRCLQSRPSTNIAHYPACKFSFLVRASAKYLILSQIRPCPETQGYAFIVAADVTSASTASRHPYSPPTGHF